MNWRLCSSHIPALYPWCEVSRVETHLMSHCTRSHAVFVWFDSWVVWIVLEARHVFVWRFDRCFTRIWREDSKFWFEGTHCRPNLQVRARGSYRRLVWVELWVRWFFVEGLRVVSLVEEVLVIETWCVDIAMGGNCFRSLAGVVGMWDNLLN